VLTQLTNTIDHSKGIAVKVVEHLWQEGDIIRDDGFKHCESAKLIKVRVRVAARFCPIYG
jgi:hypothetical protein